jgi:hypothetical protein
LLFTQTSHREFHRTTVQPRRAMVTQDHQNLQHIRVTPLRIASFIRSPDRVISQYFPNFSVFLEPRSAKRSYLKK